jgi:hypothetical protein
MKQLPYFIECRQLGKSDTISEFVRKKLNLTPEQFYGVLK